MIEEKPNFKVPLKEYYQDLDWQSVGVGVFAGFILTLALNWYTTRNDKPYDWCFYLEQSKSDYCIDLYDQSTKKMQERDDFEQAERDEVFPYGDSRIQ